MCTACLESNLSEIDCPRSLPALAQTHRLQHFIIHAWQYCLKMPLQRYHRTTDQDRENLVECHENGEHFVSLEHYLGNNILKFMHHNIIWRHHCSDIIVQLTKTEKFWWKECHKNGEDFVTLEHYLGIRRPMAYSIVRLKINIRLPSTLLRCVERTNIFK